MAINNEKLRMNNNGNHSQQQPRKTSRDVACRVPIVFWRIIIRPQQFNASTIRLKKQEQTFVGSALVLSWRDWLIIQRLFSLLCQPF